MIIFGTGHIDFSPATNNTYEDCFYAVNLFVVVGVIILISKVLYHQQPLKAQCVRCSNL